MTERAARLSKADLLTDMVGEFPELQGIMGTYYARNDGEPEDVALTASEHYQPRFAGDTLPTKTISTIVALADKLETLVGIWSIGLQPTGDKDPFALRRHALGVARMLQEKRLPLMLNELIYDTAKVFSGMPVFNDPSEDVITFVIDRLRGILREKGFSPNEVESVLDPRPDYIGDIVPRLQAVKAFAALPESISLAAANKRITNILKKTSVFDAQVDTNLLREDAERNLYASVERIRPDVEEALSAFNYKVALITLAKLRDDVDAYFNNVMVMDEDLNLRNNRLAQLKSLHFMMNRVADISKLAA
jgi:glycyl-tRNA synthetase beta chain